LTNDTDGIKTEDSGVTGSWGAPKLVSLGWGKVGLRNNKKQKKNKTLLKGNNKKKKQTNPNTHVPMFHEGEN